MKDGSVLILYDIQYVNSIKAPGVVGLAAAGWVKSCAVEHDTDAVFVRTNVDDAGSEPEERRIGVIQPFSGHSLQLHDRDSVVGFFD
jgi:hypothetical protein